jgi:ParB family chromosome partitioning protein
MTKKKRLGRGLDALLSRPASFAATAQELTPGGDQLRYIPIEFLQRGRYQPRVDMRQDTLDDLARSIRSQGIVQPIVVRPVGQGSGAAQRFEIVAGERRWRAAQIAELDQVPAIVKDIPDDAAIAMALIENIQRENLNPLEEARALDRLIREFELTHQQAADSVGRSRAAVSNLLRLLELGDKVKPLLEERQIEMGHARALLSIGNANQQFDAARLIVKNGLSVRDTERLVRRMLADRPAKKDVAGSANSNADIRRLETEISEKLGAKVRIDHTQKGGGRLLINYNNLDELDGILKHIK